MVLQISLAEATSLIKSKTGKNVSFHVENSNTVKVIYEWKTMVPLFGEFTKNVVVDITIDRVQDEVVYARYSTSGIGMDIILKAVLSTMPIFRSMCVIETLEDSRLKINLYEIMQVHEALNKFHINSITFSGSSSFFDFELIKY